MSKWKVMKNPIGPNEYIYQVYRKRFHNEPLHAGNMETTGRTYDTLEEAQAEADRRNAE